MIRNTIQAGFSLVETLVAITILLLVMIGPMTISSTTAKSTSFASEQVTAFFLAQEGIELAQKARDDMLLDNISSPARDLLSNTMWDDFADDVNGDYADCYSSAGCALEIETDDVGTVTAVDECSLSSDCRLYRSESTNAVRSRFTYSDVGTEPTLFTRAIKFIESGDEVHVESIVTWRTGSRRDNQQVVVESYLFNVYD